MNIDALIERAHRGDATAAELERLAGWRAAAEGNERHYSDVLRIIEATASLRAELSAAQPPSSLAEQVARRGQRRRESVRTADASTRDRRGTRRWQPALPWGIAAAALLLLMVNVFRQPAAEPSAAVPHTEVVTGAGEIATVQLGDGSVVRLAPESRLRVGDTGDDRAVSLDGRAFFSVTHMPDRPFRITTAAATAQVLGTRFELHAGPAALELVVVEGRVALEAARNRVVVAAGQTSAVVNGVAAEPKPTADTAALMAWTGRFLAFQNTPLRDAAREIAALYGVRITITDRALGEQTVTAVFTGQELEAVLAVICEIVNAQCTARAGEIIVSPR